MLPAEIIERKRDGEALPPDVFRQFLGSYQDGDVADYQMSAFLMAALFQGLSRQELSTLTRVIVASGRTLDFSGGDGPAVDKHSTGGVGDKVSLVLAPLLAAAGLRIPMMSGRGLGHTGGTLDKMEAIPGLSTDLGLADFRAAVDAVGCAIVSQTDDLAPLDGRLYALRDVTGTVPSLELIASSIVSKKVAEGVEALVLDVKCGRGAFMREEEEALELARVMVRLAADEGLEATALVTGMEAPLGRAVGNALEVAEAIRCLHGGGSDDLRDVTLALGAELLISADVETDRASARARLAGLLDDGTAATRFARMIERQGGDPRVVEDADLLPQAPVVQSVLAEGSGWVSAVDALSVGRAAVSLGAGRQSLDDDIDPAVGFLVERRPGETVEEGDVLARVYAANEEDAEIACRRYRDAVTIAADAADNEATAWEQSRVRWRVTGDGAEPASD